MRWLIDGYNVIRRDPALAAAEHESLEGGRRALLGLLARVAADSQEEFIVVFDGARRSGGEPAGGRVQVVFSRPPDRADDVLIRLAGQWGDGAVVVTSDRTIQSAARRARSAVLSADRFLDVLAEEGGDEDEPEADVQTPHRGNPRRPSRDVRAAERALRRLRRR